MLEPQLRSWLAMPDRVLSLKQTPVPPKRNRQELASTTAWTCLSPKSVEVQESREAS